MWEHFETFHVIFQPTYCSKFFPGQGLFLALGQGRVRTPFLGRVADLGPDVRGHHMDAAGLVFSGMGVPRAAQSLCCVLAYLAIGRTAIGEEMSLPSAARWFWVRCHGSSLRTRWQDAMLMGMGLALLANSRPWEGLVLSLPSCCNSFCVDAGQEQAAVRRFSTSSCATACSGSRPHGSVARVLLLAHDWHPLRSPYEIYEQTYGASPYMIWQHAQSEPFRMAIASSEKCIVECCDGRPTEIFGRQQHK